MAKHKSTPNQQKTVSFRLPDSLMGQLRELAKKNRRTLSGELQIAIEEHLKRQVAPNPPAGIATSDGVL
ncbi:MAG TPA: ribbon-helix-helix protein, CopG family [Gemmataceae bacterium]|nr:ribbon-helix-helix protein, CopG family [Gemmataceae bacterium]